MGEWVSESVHAGHGMKGWMDGCVRVCLLCYDLFEFRPWWTGVMIKEAWRFAREIPNNNTI